MFTSARLDVLRQVDIASVDKNALVDIQAVHIDTSAPIANRAQRFCEQIKNPYAFRVGDVAVKIEYAQDGGTLRAAITQYLAKIR